MSYKWIPNFLTLTRVLLVPVFLYFLFSDFNHGKLIAFITFIVASITDAYDGKIARKYNIESSFGVYLDPLADKIMVVSVFFCFFYLYNDIVNIYVLSMIVFRDVFVTLIRMFMEFKKYTMVTSKISKIKTLLQIVAINLMFLAIIFGGVDFMSLHSTYFLILMMITASVTFYTGIHYFVCNYGTLKYLLKFNEKN